MKPIIDLTSRFKFLAFFLLFIICNLVTAQNRPPQNIRRVSVTYQYVLENGEKTEKFWPIYQEIYDSLGRLHTEFEYDFISHTRHGIIWHTFDGKQKSRTEVFRNEVLQTINEFSYNSDSLLVKEVVKRVNTNDTTIIFNLFYTYDSKRNSKQITAKTAKGKRAFTSKSTYNVRGKELTRKVKIKKTFSPQDSILKYMSIPVYDSIGRLISEQITINKVNETGIQKIIKYSYDKINNLIGIIEYDLKGRQIRREEREYNYSRNRLSTIKYFDSNGTLVKMIGMRYEIYRTNDRRNREIDY